jgi:hypothetical protein
LPEDARTQKGVAQMLVRDRGDSWQLVLQPDHADLSGQFAEAWGGGAVAGLSRRESMILAATRHDDGWGVWDRRPGWDPERGRPRAFLDVPVPVHLAFYRAAIAAITNEDRFAGMMISMHGAGIYNGRYGTQPSLGLSDQETYRDQVDAFITEQEDAYRRISAELGVDEDDRWVDYLLLQLYDRLSLYFCLRDAEAGEADVIEPVPTGNGDASFHLEPAGPWRARIAPFPFVEAPARFTLVRRVLPKAAYEGNTDLRRDFFALTPETVQITIEEA